MTDVDLVQVNYTRMFLWMDHGFTKGGHRSSTRTATTSGR